MSGKHITNEEGKKPQEGRSEEGQRGKGDGPIAGSQQLSLEELVAWKKGKKEAEAQEKERRRLQVLYNARIATLRGEAVMDYSSQSAADAMKLEKSTWKDAVVSHEVAGAGTVGGSQSSKKRRRPDQDESDDEVLAQASKGKGRVRPKTPPTVEMNSPVVSEPTNVDYIVDSVSRSEVLRKRRRTDKDESDSEVLVKVSKGKGRVRPKTPPIVKMGSPIASESTEVQSLWSVESSDERIVSSSTTRDRNILGEDRKCRRCSKSGATCIVSERYHNLLMDFEKTGKVPVKHEACEVCRGMKVKCEIGGGQPEAVTKDRTTRKGEKGTAGGSATCVTRSQPQAEMEGVPVPVPSTSGVSSEIAALRNWLEYQLTKMDQEMQAVSYRSRDQSLQLDMIEGLLRDWILPGSSTYSWMTQHFDNSGSEYEPTDSESE